MSLSHLQRLEQLKQSGYEEEVKRVMVPDGVPLLDSPASAPLLLGVNPADTSGVLRTAFDSPLKTMACQTHGTDSC